MHLDNKYNYYTNAKNQIHILIYMPFLLRKVSRKNCYRVTNKKTKRVHSKCTSYTNAKKQIRLLNAIIYGNFKPLKNSKKNPQKVEN